MQYFCQTRLFSLFLPLLRMSQWLVCVSYGALCRQISHRPSLENDRISVQILVQCLPCGAWKLLGVIQHVLTKVLCLRGLGQLTHCVLLFTGSMRPVLGKNCWGAMLEGQWTACTLGWEQAYARINNGSSMRHSLPHAALGHDPPNILCLHALKLTSVYFLQKICTLKNNFMLYDIKYWNIVVFSMVSTFRKYLLFESFN